MPACRSHSSGGAVVRYKVSHRDWIRLVQRPQELSLTSLFWCLQDTVRLLLHTRATTEDCSDCSLASHLIWFYFSSRVLPLSRCGGRFSASLCRSLFVHRFVDPMHLLCFVPNVLCTSGV